ncbi:MAG: hypothetical protein KAU22_02490, partial [Desulfuromonadales bacterium]|nr:hypothetical protein [Desulfuromonadales bacterium]
MALKPIFFYTKAIGADRFLSIDAKQAKVLVIFTHGEQIMQTEDNRYQAYLAILKEELVPAMGCTEPIAIAYAAARAREVLGTQPERVLIEVSRNIIKNVKSVVVPNTGNLKGITASAAAGITVGEAGKVLEVISVVDDSGRKQIKDFLDNKEITVTESQGDLTFDLTVTVFAENTKASVQISHYHT